MVQYCCVPGCKNNALIPDISLHKIPLDVNMRQKWLVKIRRDDARCAAPVSKHMRVCSSHFTPADYVINPCNKYKRLIKEAVPSIFSFVEPIKRRKEPFPRVNTNFSNDEESTCSVTFPSEVLDHSDSTVDASETEDVDIISSLKDQIAHLHKKEMENLLLINSLQEEVAELKKTVLDLKSCRDVSKQYCLSSVKENVKNLKYYTGFDDINVWDAFFVFITSNGDISFSKKLNVADQLLLVMSKLRQSFDIEDLAFRFNIEEKLASKIFINWINTMYVRLGSLNIWPHRDIILQNVPDKIRDKYPNTVIIIDATEIKIEQPSSLVTQSQSFSSYKSANTLKGLIGCEPNGGIIFISQLYTGSISDKKLVSESGFLKCLEDKLNCGELLEGDAIMADKGFSIQHEIEAIRMTLNVPPFANSFQFTEEEVSNTRSIASCRIHVERAIRRVKSFKILQNTISINMLPHINQVWTVCCLLANLRLSFT